MKKVISILAILAYANIFQNEFVIDDKTFIVGWETTRDFSNIPTLLKGDVPPGQEGTYRPVRSLLYTIYYHLWGISPFFYHLHSVGVLIASSILIYFILQKILKNNFAAFTGALLFSLHPVHTEAITYISSSMDMTGAVFFFASFYLYLLWKENKKHTTYYLSLVIAFLAFFTYEMTLTLPLLIFLYEVIKKRMALLSLIHNSKFIIPYVLFAVFYLFVRVVFLKIGGKGVYATDSLASNLLLGIESFSKYIELLLFPLKQAHNHILSGGIEAIVYRGNSVAGITPSFFPSIPIAGVFVISLFILRKNKIVLFALAWFLISILPVLNIIPQGSLFHERFLYIPSFGFVLLVAWVISNFQMSRFGIGYWSLIILTTIAASYGFLTFQRNKVWKDEITFWKSDIARSPQQNAYAYFQLGNAYHAIGKRQEAIGEYEKAYEINPKFAIAQGSAAREYDRLGETKKAIELYRKAIDTDPDFWEGYFNLGNIYAKEGRISFAIFFYTKSALTNPNFLPTQDSLNSLLASPKVWKDYSGKVLFKYPVDLTLEKTRGSVRVKEPETGFMIEVKSPVTLARTLEEYVQGGQSFGVLANQGSAKIPNIDESYVKVWERNGQVDLQFFLVKEKRISEIFISRFDNAWRLVLDRILESVQF